MGLRGHQGGIEHQDAYRHDGVRISCTWVVVMGSAYRI